MEKYYFSDKNVSRQFKILEQKLKIVNPTLKVKYKKFLYLQMQKVWSNCKKPSDMKSEKYIAYLNKKSINECIRIVYEKKNALKQNPKFTNVKQRPQQRSQQRSQQRPEQRQKNKISELEPGWNKGGSFSPLDNIPEGYYINGAGEKVPLSKDFLSNPSADDGDDNNVNNRAQNLSKNYDRNGKRNNDFELPEYENVKRSHSQTQPQQLPQEYAQLAGGLNEYQGNYDNQMESNGNDNFGNFGNFGDDFSDINDTKMSSQEMMRNVEMIKNSRNNLNIQKKDNVDMSISPYLDQNTVKKNFNYNVLDEYKSNIDSLKEEGREVGNNINNIFEDDDFLMQLDESHLNEYMNKLTKNIINDKMTNFVLDDDIIKKLPKSEIKNLIDYYTKSLIGANISDYDINNINNNDIENIEEIKNNATEKKYVEINSDEYVDKEFYDDYMVDYGDDYFYAKKIIFKSCNIPEYYVNIDENNNKLNYITGSVKNIIEIESGEYLFDDIVQIIKNKLNKSGKIELIKNDNEIIIKHCNDKIFNIKDSNIMKILGFNDINYKGKSSYSCNNFSFVKAKIEINDDIEYSILIDNHNNIFNDNYEPVDNYILDKKYKIEHIFIKILSHNDEKILFKKPNNFIFEFE